jgi:hypothetical protein
MGFDLTSLKKTALSTSHCRFICISHDTYFPKIRVASQSPQKQNQKKRHG